MILWSYNISAKSSGKYRLPAILPRMKVRVYRAGYFLKNKAELEMWCYTAHVRCRKHHSANLLTQSSCRTPGPLFKHQAAHRPEQDTWSDLRQNSSASILFALRNSTGYQAAHGPVRVLKQLGYAHKRGNSFSISWWSAAAANSKQPQNCNPSTHTLASLGGCFCFFFLNR